MEQEKNTHSKEEEMTGKEFWCDGGIGRICVASSTEVKILKTFGTNNEQEYKAVIEAMRRIPESTTLYSDSQLVVNQLTMGWSVNAEHLVKYHTVAKKLLQDKHIRLIWIPREKNKAGHILERK